MIERNILKIQKKSFDVLNEHFKPPRSIVASTDAINNTIGITFNLNFLDIMDETIEKPLAQ